MKIAECSRDNRSELIGFAEDMLENWCDKSSMSHSNTCCPGRKREELLERLGDTEKYRFIYASDENKIAGFLCTEEDSENGTLYISYINVHPDFRRQNVFRLMFEYVQEKAAENNISTIKLDTWAGNDAALKAFERLGFIVEHSCSCTVKLYKPL